MARRVGPALGRLNGSHGVRASVGTSVEIGAPPCAPVVSTVGRFPRGGGADRTLAHSAGSPCCRDGAGQMPLPASRKTRALLGLSCRDRQAEQRREHLCSIFWERARRSEAAPCAGASASCAALVDEPENCRLVADRETVQLDCSPSSRSTGFELREHAATDGRRAVDRAHRSRPARTRRVPRRPRACPAARNFTPWLVAMREDSRAGWQVILLRELVALLDRRPRRGDRCRSRRCVA